MENNSGSFRKKKVYFSQVSNSALRDDNLSLKAKGLYSLIQSYITLENFILYKNTLMKQCKEGNTSFESTWKELKDTGYLIQYRLQGEKGHYCYEYELLDVADIEMASKIHGDQNRKSKENKNHNHKADVMDNDIKNHTTKTEVMDKKPHGKVGVYNKTNSNNTNLNNTYHHNKGKKGNSFIDNCETREEYSDPNYLKNIEQKLLGWDKEDN